MRRKKTSRKSDFRITAEKADRVYVERRVAAIAEELKELSGIIGVRGIHVDTGSTEEFGRYAMVTVFGCDDSLANFDDGKLTPGFLSGCKFFTYE